MKNKKSALIEIRNDTIIWCILSIILSTSLWFSYNFLSKLWVQLEEHNAKKIQTIINIKSEGVLSETPLTPDKNIIANQRWSTIQKLIPEIQQTIWVGTADREKNIETVKKITEKGNSPEYENDYIGWLKSSWGAQSKDNLEKMQKDIAEIIPIFSGVSDNPNTAHIQWKITLKKFIDFIQKDITKKYHLGNAVGSIGISGVQFSKTWSEIGAYNIPLNFNKVSNQDVLALLDFLSKTWWIQVKKVDNGGLIIEHTNVRDVKWDTESNISQLKNPLITVPNVTIWASNKDENIRIDEPQDWDISMTLTFYIRWASADHITKMNTQLTNQLWDTQPGKLIERANKTLKTCQNTHCTDENRIADIVNLLNSAKNAYTWIRNSDSSSNPISMVTRRSSLMSTVETLEKKLTQIESTQKNDLNPQ